MKKILILITIVITSFCLTGCLQIPELHVTIQGSAINAKTNEPIQGVLITIIPGSMSRLTDYDGEYKFDNIPYHSQYTLTTQSEGFYADKKTINISSSEPEEVVFILQPK